MSKDIFLFFHNADRKEHTAICNISFRTKKFPWSVVYLYSNQLYIWSHLFNDLWIKQNHNDPNYNFPPHPRELLGDKQSTQLLTPMLFALLHDHESHSTPILVLDTRCTPSCISSFFPFSFSSSHYPTPNQTISSIPSTLGDDTKNT